MKTIGSRCHSWIWNSGFNRVSNLPEVTELIQCDPGTWTWPGTVELWGCVPATVPPFPPGSGRLFKVHIAASFYHSHNSEVRGSLSSPFPPLPPWNVKYTYKEHFIPLPHPLPKKAQPDCITPKRQPWVWKEASYAKRESMNEHDSQRAQVGDQTHPCIAVSHWTGDASLSLFHCLGKGVSNAYSSPLNEYTVDPWTARVRSTNPSQVENLHITFDSTVGPWQPQI